jgi:calcium/calmodulin-dependent protein kinase I
VTQKCFLYELEMMRDVVRGGSVPHLLKISKIYEGENNIYCVGEHYSGGTLYDYIKEHGKPTEAQSISIIRQMLKALVHLEGKDLIHRDIKPENILFQDMTLKTIALVDFGFMTRVKEYNSLFTRCGTPGYVAPEVLADKPYNTKIDVFSTGLLMYLLITKQNPFHDKSYTKLIQKNKSGVVDFGIVNNMPLENKTHSKQRIRVSY